MTELMVAGAVAEDRGIALLRSRGYWVDRAGQGIYSPHLRDSLRGTRSVLRWWVDVQCGEPGIRNSLRLVDIKSRMPWRDGPDISIEIAPLMLAISGVMSHPTMFMVDDQWAPASRAWEKILPPGRGHCCDIHHQMAVCAIPDDVEICLRVIRDLPEKCRPTRGCGDPYVWVDSTCLRPIPYARGTL
jgi:hypothetical protein